MNDARQADCALHCYYMAKQSSKSFTEIQFNKIDREQAIRIIHHQYQINEVRKIL